MAIIELQVNTTSLHLKVPKDFFESPDTVRLQATMEPSHMPVLWDKPGVENRKARCIEELH